MTPRVVGVSAPSWPRRTEAILFPDISMHVIKGLLCDPGVPHPDCGDNHTENSPRAEEFLHDKDTAARSAGVVSATS